MESKPYEGLLLEVMKIHGVIRSAKAALIIGKTIIADMYGQQLVDLQEPFIALNEGDKWFVRGSVAKPGDRTSIVLSKQDGTVIDIEVPSIPFNVWAREPD